MPQIFPMNWIFLYILFSLILILNFINMFFFIMNKNYKNYLNIQKKMFFLKW
nr:ATP synthase F0 subunit 8 [Ixodes rubicundus]